MEAAKTPLFRGVSFYQCVQKVAPHRSSAIGASAEGRLMAMDDELREVLEEMRQENTAAHAETRRHCDIVAEDLRHELRIVAEGSGSLTERIVAWMRTLSK
jgi:hypothetical protein